MKCCKYLAQDLCTVQDNFCCKQIVRAPVSACCVRVGDIQRALAHWAVPKGMEKPEIVICGGHTRPVVDVQFSDTVNDTHWFVTASKDGKPMLRIGQSGDWVGTL